MYNLALSRKKVQVFKMADEEEKKMKRVKSLFQKDPTCTFNCNKTRLPLFVNVDGSIMLININKLLININQPTNVNMFLTYASVYKNEVSFD